MPTDGADLAAIRERHRSFSGLDGRTPPYCRFCQRLWPCDAGRLGEALDAATREPHAFEIARALEAARKGLRQAQVAASSSGPAHQIIPILQAALKASA